MIMATLAHAGFYRPFLTAWLIAFRKINSGAKNKSNAGLFVRIIPPDCGNGFPSQNLI